MHPALVRNSLEFKSTYNEQNNMAKLSVVFVCLLILHVGSGAPKKATTTDVVTEKNHIQEIGEHVKAVAVEVAATINNIMPDNKKVVEVLTAQSKLFATNLEQMAAKIQTEMAKNKGNVDNFTKNFGITLSETIASIRQYVGTDAMAKGNELKAKFETEYKKVADNVEELVQHVKPNMEKMGETMNTFTKALFDDFMKFSETLKSQIDHSLLTSPKMGKTN